MSSASFIWSEAETWTSFLLRAHQEKLELQELREVQDLLGELVYRETRDRKERLENRFMVSFSFMLSVGAEVLIRKSPELTCSHPSPAMIFTSSFLFFRVPLVRRGPPGRMVSLVRGYGSSIQRFPWIPLSLLTAAVCLQGDRGDPGPEGLAGAAGSTGPEGPVGFTGSPGDRGNNVSVPHESSRPRPPS